MQGLVLAENRIQARAGETEADICLLMGHTPPCSPSHLTSLTMHACMQVLPPTIAHLTSLTALDVSSNDLEELPLGLAGLYRLQHVKLDRNKLYCLPAVLLRLPDLRSLSASWNRIVALSADVSSLRQVQRLPLHLPYSHPAILSHTPLYLPHGP